MYGQAILNKSLSARSSAHASLPQFSPVQRHTGPHCYPSDPLNHKIRRAEPHGWNGALFPFHATREQTTVSQWVTGFMVNLESQAKLLCCAHCTAKRTNAAFKINTDQRVTTTAYREKRGKLVTKPLLPEPSPWCGEWTRWVPSNHPQRLKSVDGPPMTDYTDIHLKIKWVNGDTKINK